MRKRQHPGTKTPITLAFLMCIGLGLSHLTFAAPQTTTAADTDLDQALSISAAKAEIDEKQGWAIYSGDVVLKQGSLAIRCETLEIFRSPTGIDKVIASGSPAEYSQNFISDKAIPNEGNPENAEQQTIKASANRITYELEARAIELVGKARIQQADNIFEGHSILYQIENRKIIARSDSRPGNDQDNISTPNQTDPAKPKNQRVKIILPVRQRGPATTETQNLDTSIEILQTQGDL